MRFWLLMARLHVLGREAAGVELVGVEIDHHLRPLAAPGLGHARPCTTPSRWMMKLAA